MAYVVSPRLLGPPKKVGPRKKMPQLPTLPQPSAALFLGLAKQYQKNLIRPVIRSIELTVLLEYIDLCYSNKLILGLRLMCWHYFKNNR